MANLDTLGSPAGCLADAELALDRAWLTPDAADALFAALQGQLPWSIHRVRLFGREHASPRLSCWIGDPQAVYRYSGSRHVPHPWLPALSNLRARLLAETGVDCNSVLANLYRDGNDAMGWHSDDEPELGSQPLVASISLGATRRFVLRHRRDPQQRLALELPHGSLLLMRGDTQRNYRHALPRTARVVAPRINLTFRRIVG